MSPAVKPISKQHPLDSLTEQEILAISSVTRLSALTLSSKPIHAVKHLTIALLPPPKLAVLAHLSIPLQTGDAPSSSPPPTLAQLGRRAESVFLDVENGYMWELRFKRVEEGDEGGKVGDWMLESQKLLEEGLQPQISPEELDRAQGYVRADERVKALAAEVGLLPEQISCDGWSIGYDARFDKKLRLQQCLLFARFDEHSNLYAHPLDFFPVLDSNSGKVIHIDFLTSRFPSPHPAPPTEPPSLIEDSSTAIQRTRIPPPLEPHEYLPEFMPEGFKYRDTLKPLHVVQPEGVSFKLDEGGRLSWEKWDLHVGFHHREGLVLSTVTYQDEQSGFLRPLFYRLSIAEMVVPYADPGHPHPQKHAFDVGEYGLGTLANDLTLGCDCLGAIAYLPGVFVGNDGTPKKINHAICIHEEDSGILWKHTDYRTGGRSRSVRGRKLVIQSAYTVANYEYIIAFSLHQDGTIEFETKLTGVLNVSLLAEGESADPYGVEVAPRINAHFHQHLFSFRIDPMIDGLANTVVESDIITSPHLTGSQENFAGNAFVARKKVLETTGEAARDADPLNERSWSIAGTRRHYASGLNGSYKIMTSGATPRLLAQKDSWVAKRAPFATHQLWVTPFVEEQLYPAGKYVPQTRDAPSDSIGFWMEGDKAIKEKDIVLYLTYGVTHVPRPEDFPVMPAEHLRLFLKPTSFFRSNPALDVPSTHDLKSVNALGTGATKVNGNGVEEGGLEVVNGGGADASCVCSA
ncbi:copper amine oxidase [Mrakia frigida]|uniref:copper amine oxidase n=1 Tax=Mrakia frigida TaxID=29902 RepID=UPI003FCC2592